MIQVASSGVISQEETTDGAVRQSEEQRKDLKEFVVVFLEETTLEVCVGVRLRLLHGLALIR